MVTPSVYYRGRTGTPVDLENNVLSGGGGDDLSDLVYSYTTSEKLIVKDTPKQTLLYAPELSSLETQTPIKYTGLLREVSDETELVNALTASKDLDIIRITANIVLTSTLVIDKSIKLEGNYTLSSAGAGTDPVMLINVTADNVHFAKGLVISHNKTTNTSVEVCVNTNALNFISEATINFMEFGYILRGSFKISGETNYIGALGNNHRHISIFRIDENSEIRNVEYDFPEEATPRCSFIFQGVQVLETDKFNAYLKVLNCRQKDYNKTQRQFYLLEVFSTDGGAGLIFEQNQFNERYGAIGILVVEGVSPFDLFESIELYNNYQGADSYDQLRNKGLLFIDGSGAIRDAGNTVFKVSNNVVREPNKDGEYSSAYGNGVICYENTLFNPFTITPEEVETEKNYISSVVVSGSGEYKADLYYGDNFFENKLYSLYGTKENPLVTFEINNSLFLDETKTLKIVCENKEADASPGSDFFVSTVLKTGVKPV